MGHTYTKKLSVVYWTFKLDWVPHILSGQPALQEHISSKCWPRIWARKHGSLFQAHKYSAKLSPLKAGVLMWQDKTPIRPCFLSHRHLKNSKRCFLCLHLGRIDWGLHSVAYISLDLGENWGISFSKSRPLMPQGWVVSRGFSGWMGPNPNTEAGLFQALSSSGTCTRVGGTHTGLAVCVSGEAGHCSTWEPQPRASQPSTGTGLAEHMPSGRWWGLRWQAQEELLGPHPNLSGLPKP